MSAKPIWTNFIFSDEIVDNNPSTTYHENSKLRGRYLYEFSSKIEAVTNNADALGFMQFAYKSYKNVKRIPLNKPELNHVLLEDVLLQRKSSTNFSGQPICRTSLDTLLFYCLGQRERGENDNKTTRMYPSAGALYPTEAYLLNVDIDGLNRGVYHYNAVEHALEHLYRKDEALLDLKDYILFPESELEKISAVVVLTSVFTRTKEKYGERGYRFGLLEAGHVSQNFYLVSTALGIELCSMGGYLDLELEARLGIDGITESVVCAMAIGGKS
ncbi:MAG: SagB/ThcOx family dehydrogenase [Chloroflexota bacterium]